MYEGIEYFKDQGVVCLNYKYLGNNFRFEKVD
jgi:hypothetical protein